MSMIGEHIMHTIDKYTLAKIEVTAKRQTEIVAKVGTFLAEKTAKKFPLEFDFA